MSETVFYVRGNFPFGFDKPVTADLVADAKLALDIEVGALSAMAQELGAYQGFLDREVIQKILANYTSDAKTAHRLARLISAVDARLRGPGLRIEDFIQAIRDWQGSDENPDGSLLSPEEIEELAKRMPLFLRPYDGMRRQAKAKRLSTSIGMQLEALEIICDLRPVFDEEKEVVEGIIPLTTLKVVCQGVDGLPVSIEAVMSEKAVASLAKNAAAAVQKLSRLRELLAAKELTVPTLDITKRED